MASMVSHAVTATRPDSLAMTCVLAAIDESGHARKVFASDCGLSEQEFSKALSSQRFDVRWLDAMPPVVVLDAIGRYAKVKFGAYLRLPEPADLLALVLAQVEGLTGQVRQLQIVHDLRKSRSNGAA